MDLFNEHEWMQVEAQWSSSVKYNKTENETDENGDSYSVNKTYYHWYYTYQVNGIEYKCVENEISEEKPYSEDYSIDILAATDDPGIYMLYSSEEIFKEHMSFSNKLSFTFPLFLWIVFILFPTLIIPLIFSVIWKGKNIRSNNK
ncbi:MAG: hypothetical protein J6K58_02925 [Lachnospiraceae bacterium]|nr:hypothetical protein [Lachnospiraceae bacterium]